VYVFPSFLSGLQAARKQSIPQDGKQEVGAWRFAIRRPTVVFMSESDPKSPSPALVAGIIFVFQIVGMAIMGATGAMARLPQGVQFLFGLEAVGFPLLVYFLLKRRENRGG
jgi:hypothetical protein